MNDQSQGDRRYRVAVIGAGIVGVSTAIWLQRKGHDVVLIDREGPAAGTSYGNAGVLAACSVVPVTVPGLIGKVPKMLLDGDSPLFLRWTYLLRLMPWLRQYLKHCNPEDVRRIAKALTPILSDTLAQHQALAQDTPAAEFIRPTDYYFVYENRSIFEAEALSWGIRRECGYEWEELDTDELIARDPGFAGGSSGFAVSVGKHGFITDPGRYVKTLAEYFLQQGGNIFVGSVDDLQGHQGWVSGVVTDNGVVECERAVVATGVWSEALTRKLGVRVPMEAERGYHVEFYGADRLPQHPSMIASGKFVATPMTGRLRCAGIVEFGGLKALASRKPLDLLRRQVHAVFPGITYDRTEEWLGHRPAPVDSIPLIGELGELSGVYAGFGHQHVGLTGGAKTGRILADLISGHDPGLDMTPYRPDRFSA
ncbi:MAG: FAD-binding oxidoreductase [Granulosicoccus sp.]|nr:FAD-binding oxidoreductase [Granulosicoccus sp.]